MELQTSVGKSVPIVAIVEDDKEQLEYLRRCLEPDYVLNSYSDATAFVRSLSRRTPDVVLLDWHLPDMTGIELLTQLRGQGHHMLAMVITARNDEDSLITAFEAGANDFIAKPVRAGEIKARVRALTRRAVIVMEAREHQIGAYRLDMVSRQLFLDGQQMRLTNREFDLAALLLQRQGELLHRETLLRSVWGVDESISTRTLDTHISRLRKKLSLSGEYGLRLRSVYQLGYRLEKTA